MQGSSPRVRGKPIRERREVDRCRLIPACAGKTDHQTHFTQNWRAHPRVCGENPVKHCAEIEPGGSSPRVRGKRIRHRQHFHSNRLIPACAGKTRPSCRASRRAEAHPRVCGENLGELVGGAAFEGSSPRVRGKHHPHQRSRAGKGLIPACAGKTNDDAHKRLTRGAHPRVCGENTVAISS